ELKEAMLKDVKKAEPKARKGNVSLAALSRSVLGRRLLKEQKITDTKIPEGDPRLTPLKEAYDRLLVELELDHQVAFPLETHQVTFNGKVAEDEMEYMASAAGAEPASVQSELTEYITSYKEAKRKPKKKGRKKPRKSSGRKKKKGGA
ncbi:MAG: hypothetical protein ACFFAX_01050, partial [Promethearchaeota archaeon]